MKRKKKHQKKFSVHLELRAWEIAKAGAALTLMIKGADGSPIGTMEVGQGSLGWKPANKQKFKRRSWAAISALLEDRK